MKAVVYVGYFYDEADTATIQDAVMDAAMNVCPEELGTGECWCEVGASQILTLTDNQAVDWEVVEMDDEND